MIKVKISTPARAVLTEAVHVDVALYGNDDKIQIMVTMGVYFYEVHLVALDDEAVKWMPWVYKKIEMALREAQPRIEFDIFSNEMIWVGEPKKGQYSVTIGKPETQVAAS